MKKGLLFYIMALVAIVAGRSQTVEPTWESLNQRSYPQWFSDAKLGIFVHWGLYSVPAYASTEGYAEWFYRGLMVGDSGRQAVMSLYADTTQAVFDQYAALADHWHAELWRPDQWANLFRRSGARYVLLVTKHHDGYCLWDSPLQPTWNSTMSGPRRNIVEELTAAVRNEGLRMGFYYSLPEWTNPRHIWMRDADDSIADYVDNYMVPQFKELVRRFRPDVIFSDGDWQNTAEQFHAEELISWYYNLVGPDAVVNNRWGRGTAHGFLTPEYSQGIVDVTTPWAECRGVGRSFGFNRNEDVENFLTDRQLIQHFCELVSAGGGLTLNVGPMADGTIPFIQQERLLALGRWLEVNGEAIYGTTPYVDADCHGNVISNHTVYSRTTASLPDASAIGYDWVRNAPLKQMPVDHFSIRWVGMVEAPADGDYIFRIEANDEATVSYLTPEASAEWVGELGDEALSGFEPQMQYHHSWAENDGAQRTLHLHKGERRLFCVDYREKDLEATVHFTWSRDGGKRFEPVPAAWKGKATWERTMRCFTRKGSDLYVIEFERPGRQLTLGDLPRLKKGTTIQLLGTTAELKWKQQKDGSVVVDLSPVSAAEMNRLEHAWVFKIGGAL
jgi:alpha-L-fucosidase